MCVRNVVIGLRFLSQIIIFSVCKDTIFIFVHPIDRHA